MTSDGNLAKRWAAEPPRYIYRYLSLANDDRRDWAAQLIRESQLYLSNALTFNDPFDCLPRMRTPSTRTAVTLRLKRDRQRVGTEIPKGIADASLASISRMRPEDLQRFAEQTFRNTVGRIGIACFSEREDDVLMWSHYADCHRGICVRFDTTRWPMAGSLTLLLKVAYSDDRPVLNFPSRPGTDRTEELFDVLTTKALFWSAEHEWRLMAAEKAQHMIPIPPDLIDAVIVGANAPDDVKGLVRQWLGPSRAILDARIDPEHFRLKVS